MGFINLADHLFKVTGIPSTCDVIFVSDMFVDEYVGGAELTTEAILQSCPLNVYRLKSRDVTMQLLEKGFEKFWIFGNYSNLDQNLIPTICANLRYSIIEYDYKYCRYRSPEKHLENEKQQCGCDNEPHGKLISAFMFGARSLWWMSERQQDHYQKLFPFLRQKSSTVLSSVFDDATFALIKLLRDQAQGKQRKGWIVMGSPSWIKGTAESEQWCKDKGLDYSVVWGESYAEVLKKLSTAEGLVFLPRGGDTCPRMVIEAKLLGCKLQLNDNVQHKDEIWFNTDDMFDTESYLYMSRDRFWNGIKADMAYSPRLSGYTTTKDCISQDYPFIESITSMMEFCDEVVVVDGGSTDGTWEALENFVNSYKENRLPIANKSCELVIHQQKRDWNHPRFAVFDGAQKALARSLCTGEYCWQQDSDEIVHEDDYKKVKDLVKQIPKNLPLIALPIVEYWGSTQKVRLDVNLWKWRISQNIPIITHGIPAGMREFDADGELYSKPGCDGCWYIRNDSYEMIPTTNFFTPDMENVKKAALVNPDARKQLELWFNIAIKSLPTVYHFSWLNIERKIKTYRDYWSKHWLSLHNVSQDDTAESNMFFDKPWSDVADDEIRDLAKRLKDEMGGWIFHRKIDFDMRVPHINCEPSPPAIMSDWIKRNS